MRNIKITKNPFLLFLPFLLLYIVLVLIIPTHGTTGDENRYLMFAENLTHGFYSPASPHIDIGDGPGYPILLMPFVALGLPLISITLLNAVLYYISIVLLFKALQQVVSFPIALICSLFWGCFYNSYENILLILPETFTSFLVSLLVFSLLKAFNSGNAKEAKKYIYLSGFIIGYIALTKVIFGYVLLFILIVSGFVWIINRNKNYRNVVIIFLIGLATSAPYLIYTYYVTNKMFYWGTSGGDNLYWMSTPYEGEYGDWIHYPIDTNSIKSLVPGADKAITENHQMDFEMILQYKGAERDDVYRKIAINNIKSHPVKFIRNCISNMGRIFFNFPYSYTIQKNATLVRLFLNGIIIVCMLFCLIPTLINWHKIIFPIRFLLFFALMYLGGSMLGSAETRMFTVIVPILLFWIAFIIQRSVKLNIAHW